MKTALAKSVAVILFTFVCAVGCAAQETCGLEQKTAPLLLNLRLEMSPEQTQNVFGKDLKVKIKKKGERVFFQNFIKQPAPERLRGVRALYLRFFNGKIYQIEIFYEARQELKTLENITDALAADFEFNAADWKIKNNRAEIKCGEASLVADNILNPRVELTNETIRAEIIELRKKDE